MSTVLEAFLGSAVLRRFWHHGSGPRPSTGRLLAGNGGMAKMGSIIIGYIGLP